MQSNELDRARGMLRGRILAAMLIENEQEAESLRRVYRAYEWLLKEHRARCAGQPFLAGDGAKNPSPALDRVCHTE